MTELLMYASRVLLVSALAAYSGLSPAQQKKAAKPVVCKEFNIDDRASKPLQQVQLPPTGACQTGTINGFPTPDPTCTPGAINPTLTADVLRHAGFTTKRVRNDATTAKKKAQTYGWYKIKHP